MNFSEQITGDLGVVLKQNGTTFTVLTGHGTLGCTLAGRLAGPAPGSRLGRKQARQQTPEADTDDRLAVGDLVRVTTSGPGSGQITALLPRRNRLARRSAVPMPGAHAHQQVLAANLDVVVAVFATANPKPHWNMLDRILVSAESLEIPGLVCISKADLVRQAGELPEDLSGEIETYRRIGYPVLVTSACSGQGLEELRQALAGRSAAFIGKSGVGKTALLNALQPGLGQRVQEVNPVTGKGRHTTTQAELHLLDWGGAVIDTPGVREFGLWDVEQDDLALFFPEMRSLVGQCCFRRDCAHLDEPGCAIRKAVMAGQIAPRRYQSFLRLREDGYFE